MWRNRRSGADCADDPFAEEDQEWVVEDVTDVAYIDHVRHYRIKWADSDKATWEPVENLEPALVQSFEAARKKRKDAKKTPNKKKKLLKKKKLAEDGEGQQPKMRKTSKVIDDDEDEQPKKRKTPKKVVDDEEEETEEKEDKWIDGLVEEKEKPKNKTKKTRKTRVFSSIKNRTNRRKKQSTPEDETSVFDVEMILKTKFDSKRKKDMAFVKWDGYTSEDNTWEPVENLVHLDAWRRFRKEQRNKKGKAISKLPEQMKTKTKPKKAQMKAFTSEYDSDVPAAISQDTQDDEDEPSSSSENEAAVEWHSGDEFEVEDIICSRQNDSGAVEYLVKWKDWDVNYNSWVQDQDLDGCSELLKNFLSKTKSSGKLRRLSLESPASKSIPEEQEQEQDEKKEKKPKPKLQLARSKRLSRNILKKKSLKPEMNDQRNADKDGKETQDEDENVEPVSILRVNKKRPLSMSPSRRTSPPKKARSIGQKDNHSSLVDRVKIRVATMLKLQQSIDRTT